MVCPMKHEQLGNFSLVISQVETPSFNERIQVQAHMTALINPTWISLRTAMNSWVDPKFFFCFFFHCSFFFIFSLPHKYPSLISKLLKEISEVLLQLSEQINASLSGTEVGDVKDPKHS